MDNRLGEYLRARRDLIRPEEHGMPAPGNRRVAGLRREEVAMLAGLSTDYYLRLEQGRERRPSPQVVDALAGALLLDAEAAAHLRELAQPEHQKRPVRPERVSPSLLTMLDRWPHTPALLLGRYQDVLAANALGTALFSWLGAERNLLRALFRDPAAREFYVNWPKVALNCVAALRATSGGDPEDSRLTSLVGELSVHSPEFARYWARHDVRGKTHEAKTFRHPVVGELTLSYDIFSVDSEPGQKLVVYQAERNSPAEHTLALLGSLAVS